ncbi:MAG: hypothetical protein SGJ23_09055 [Alphaproteobacteria bacterium]|nr:hypothetical protein [Alphaproteobacteria bacterium]
MKVSPSALALAAFSIAYPILAVLAMRTIGPWPVVGLLCVLLMLRGASNILGAATTPMTLALIAVAIAVASVSVWNPQHAVRLYPFFMNAASLVAFVNTLVRPPTMIERFARIREPNLPESGVRYTRKATIAWCIFIFINGAIALWTAFFADLNTWALYNGVIAYVAMGLMFGGELLVRRGVKAREAAANAPQ